MNCRTFIFGPKKKHFLILVSIGQNLAFLHIQNQIFSPDDIQTGTRFYFFNNVLVFSRGSFKGMLISMSLNLTSTCPGFRFSIIENDKFLGKPG
jgi:hypothetical protein